MKLSIQDEIDEFLGQAKMTGADIVVLVEDPDDEAFWRRLLEAYLPDKKTDFPRYKATGKDGLLKDYAAMASPKIVVCVDADNDTLISSKHSKWLSPRTPFIFHTYAHSRESHFIYPQNLRTECREITNKEHDFEADFTAISKLVQPWLMLWLYCRDENQAWLYKEMPSLPARIAWSVLKGIAEAAYSEAEQAKETIADWRDTFLGALAARLHENTEATYEFFEANGHSNLHSEIDEFFQNCPVSAESLFFIQGHTAFDAIIRPYFHKIIQFLAIEQQLSADVKDRKNHWQKISSTDYTHLLTTSYRLCLIQPRFCHFLEKIRIHVTEDFQTT